MQGEFISIREFGRRLGVSDTAVHKAVKSGKIVEGLVTNAKGKPVIDFAVAKREWLSHGGHSLAPNSTLLYDEELQADHNYETKREPEPKQTKPKPVVQEAAPIREELPPAPPPQVPVTERPQPQPEQSGQMSIVEAKRQAAIFDAKLKGLELAKQQKVLVPREKVYKSLFSFGQEIRNAFLAIPDRVIDDVLACKSRNEAHALLYQSITQELEKLADAKDRDFTV